jgi:voltage-gated potassium channel Kch
VEAVVARTTWRDRLRFWFDSTMDRGTPALIGWLGLASLILIVVVSGLAVLLAPGDRNVADGGWQHVVWMSLLRTLDPGTMGADKGYAVFLALMLTSTIGGIFIVSSLIGVLTTGLEKQIARLRKGRAPLFVHGHAVVLGWSDQVFTVVSELVKANRSGRRSVVVILADQDKIDMDDQIKARVGETGRIRVICRSGSPLKRTDLELVSLDTARSIMVLSPAVDDADIDVIKVLLLLSNRAWSGVRPSVVAAVRQSLNLPAALLAAGPDAVVVDAEDIAVRIVVESYRQSGLSSVCVDLLDFAGNELYLRAEPALSGRTYGEALHAYELGRPIGLRHVDGTVVVNPPMQTRIADTDQVIVIADDDLLIQLADEPVAVDEHAIITAPHRAPTPDRTLLLGWNTRAPKILDLLDGFVEPGSILDVAAPHEPDGLNGVERANLRVGYRPCQPTSRSALEGLELGAYQHIIVLNDDRFAPDLADDRTLVTLLHLRDIETRLGDPYSIVAEMNDDINREIAQVTKVDDFIVSTRLISLLLTQLAENRHLYPVFTQLFSASGSEIYLKPITDYITTQSQVSFATVIEAARRRDESAIGYRLQSRSDQPPAYGVVLNPPPATPITLTTGDSIVVVAQD